MKKYKPEPNAEWADHLICFGYKGSHAWCACEDINKKDHKVECFHCGIRIPNNYIQVADNISNKLFSLL